MTNNSSENYGLQNVKLSAVRNSSFLSCCSGFLFLSTFIRPNDGLFVKSNLNLSRKVSFLLGNEARKRKKKLIRISFLQKEKLLPISDSLPHSFNAMTNGILCLPLRFQFAFENVTSIDFPVWDLEMHKKVGIPKIFSRHAKLFYPSLLEWQHLSYSGHLMIC